MSSSDRKTIKEFPDLSSKLAAPSKKSLFERQKAEAEAKRVREEAETAAVYEDFVKSFENEGNDSYITGASNEPSSRLGSSTAHQAARTPTGPPKRHFAPGSRSSGPGSLGPPPNLMRKRPYDDSRSHDRDREKRIFAFEDESPADATNAFRTSDDEVDDKNNDASDGDRAAPRPTLQLSSLPPGTSPAVIKALIPSKLKVEAVRLLPPALPGTSQSTERKSLAAIVTLAGDTPANDIDVAVNSLQNRYLGWGYNLSISRHLSSAALGALNTTAPALNSGLSSLPFGAKPAATGPASSLSRAPPPPSDVHRGGYAPPSSYSSNFPGRPDGRSAVHVKVQPPSDIKQLKLIHKTVETLLTHGPEFEALLMSRPEVQKEEKWAWIWNPRSPGGVWYRWRLWEILTGAKSAKSKRGRYVEKSYRLFDGAAAWLEPEESLPFEFSTQLQEVVSDSDYNSSEEDDSGDEAPMRKRRHVDGGDPPIRESANQNIEDYNYLNPLQKAKLTHLLARLPTTLAKLRKGDVARVTAFAISHAGHGAEEVVDMLVDNIVRPFAWSKRANPELKDSDQNIEDNAADGNEEKQQQNNSSDKKENLKEDTSGSTLIALHLVSDILSASSTSGVRHAWRYRSLFESTFASRAIFPYLGRIEKMLGWGRLRADKWRRSVGNLMQLWEGWCVFPAGTHERFVGEFSNPPLTEEELQAEEEKKRKELQNDSASGNRDVAKSKWKTVDVNEAVEADAAPAAATVELADENIDGEAMEDIDGVPMEDIDGEPMDDIDGEPMDDFDGEPMDDIDGEPVGETDPTPTDGKPEAGVEEATLQAVEPFQVNETSAARAKRQRPKAEDMFAGSDED